MTHNPPVALITGARRGIGRGIALALADAGFDLVLNDIERDDDAAETMAEIDARGRRATFITADIADLVAQERLVESAWDAFGGVDCLVNNAGVSVLSRGDLLDVTPESYDRCMSINLRAPFFLSQRIARRMIDAPTGRGPRTIINITSVSADLVTIARGEYCISKAGGSMMTDLFATRLAEDDILVYQIRPGIIDTDMTTLSKERYDREIPNGLTPIRRWGKPADVGNAAVLLATGALPFSPGQSLKVDGGLSLHQF